MREYTLWRIVPLTLLVLLAACSNSIEEVSKLPPRVEKPPPMVSAQLNDALKEAQIKNLGLRAKLILDGTDTYDMEITNGVATWQKMDLPTQSAYDVVVRFELEYGADSGKFVLAAEAGTSHDFSAEPTKRFKAGDFTSEFDEDGDTMSNLKEMLAGGNPFNEAPTLISAAQITVAENSTQVLTVLALSPREAAKITYSIKFDEKGLFSIVPGTGLLSFKIPMAFDKIIGATNQHSVTILADDQSFTTEQSIVVTVTNVFDLKVAIGLKQLKFELSPAANASYYKIVQSINGSTFKELPASGAITSLTYSHAVAVHRFDPINTQFMLRAYDSIGQIAQSEPIRVTANQINGAIGYVKSSLAARGDKFGDVVALSADGNTLAVAATGESGYTSSVHIFSRATGTWKSQGNIKAPNSDLGDRFGSAIVLSANGNTLVVDASGESSASRGVNDNTVGLGQYNNSAFKSGAVYVFDRALNTDGFVLRDYVKAPNSDQDDNFGISVAISAEGNTLVVGAYREASDADGVNNTVVNDNSARAAGAVYVFDRTVNTDSFVFRDYIKAPNSDAGDVFGTAVAVSANGNTLVVGAIGESSAALSINDTSLGLGQANNSAQDTGAVYVYNRVGKVDSFVFKDYIKASNSDAGDFFGSQVAVSADGNTLVVGAAGEASAANGIYDTTVGKGDDNSFAGLGAVYVFERTSKVDTFVFRVYIKAPNNGAGGAYFGTTVAFSADGRTLVVGVSSEDNVASGVYYKKVAQGDNSSVSGVGAAYVFDRARKDDAFVFLTYVKASNSDGWDGFGSGVALSFDGNILVVGAGGEASGASGINDSTMGLGQDDNSVFNAGAVYLY